MKNTIYPYQQKIKIINFHKFSVQNYLIPINNLQAVFVANFH